jgi:hypothetical protein
MQHQKAAVLFSLLLNTAGCATDKYYAADQIIVEKYYGAAAGMALVYRAPMETLYYSSGCDAAYNGDSSEVHLKFIHQRINTEFEGNLKSRMTYSNNQLNYTLSLPSKVKQAYINDKLIAMK